MREQGSVIEITRNNAKVRLMQKPECAKCGLCGGAGGGFRFLSVKTQKPLKIGQTVTLEINEKILTVSSILLYGAPLAGFVAGAIAGYIIGKEIVATILAIGLAAVDFLTVKFIINKKNLAERAAKIIE